MSIAGDFARWVAGTNFFTALRESALPYPIVMSLHLTCIAIFGGLILITDLRLLGVALRDVSVTDVVRRTRPWKRLGFVIMITMGVLLAGSKLDTYYDNPYFLLKLTLLALVGVHAIIFHRSVYANTEAIDKAPRIPGAAKAAAVLSLVLWVGILSMGRWIAYYERPDQYPRATHPVELPPAPP